MGEKHLTKNGPYLWRVSTKIMSKLLGIKERAKPFFLATPCKIDTRLLALVVALCFNNPQCSDPNQIACKRS